jgi:5,10-methylenetetrahydromethanopterin reductase
VVERVTLTGSPAKLAARLAALADQGITEVAYQPMGDDIARELRTFAEAAGVVGAPA